MAREGRLWLDGSMNTTLTTAVIAVREHEDKTMVVTKETIFFPGGGGQAPDEGSVSCNELLGIVELEEGFGHLIKEPFEGTVVDLKLDEGAREYAAQQHTGQHILSAICYREHGLKTVSVHFGKDMCTLDLDTPLLQEDVIREIERGANRLCRQAIPIKGHLLSAKEVATFPNLRKEPQVDEDIRIVELSDYDATPCCGTHLENTAQAAPIMLVGQMKMRGKARLQFLCGHQALIFANQNIRDLAAIAELFKHSSLRRPCSLQASGRRARETSLRQ